MTISKTYKRITTETDSPVGHDIANKKQVAGLSQLIEIYGSMST